MSTRVFYRVADEFIEATVSADVELAAQVVSLSIDRGETWISATWQGSAGTTRVARTTLPVDGDVIFPRAGVYPLLARVVDGSETVVFQCGGIAVR